MIGRLTLVLMAVGSIGAVTLLGEYTQAVGQITKVVEQGGVVETLEVATQPSATPATEKNETPPLPQVAQPTATVPVAEDATRSGQEEVIMARVGDRKITVNEFMQYISQDTRLVVKTTTDNGKAEVLREMILDRLIEEGMRRDGLLPTDRPLTPKDYMQAYRQLAARRFSDANVVPAEEKIHQYYLDHQELFGIPAMVRISQIQLRVPTGATPEERKAVKERAEDILKRLRAGESFAELARALTENLQAKVVGGDLGFLPLKQDRWLDQAVAGLKVGQFSDVLESPVGYEILLLTEQRDSLLAPYANVRDTVLAKMRQEAQRKAREAYAWQLAKEIGVKVEMEELKSAIP